MLSQDVNARALIRLTRKFFTAAGKGDGARGLKGRGDGRIGITGRSNAFLADNLTLPKKGVIYRPFFCFRTDPKKGKVAAMLTGKKKKYFRQILEQAWDRLTLSKHQTPTDGSIEMELLPDLLDKASAESERDFNLVLRERGTDMIRELRDALEKLDNGTYGLCEECGDEISEQRLEVRPEAVLCIRCQRNQELI